MKHPKSELCFMKSYSYHHIKLFLLSRTFLSLSTGITHPVWVFFTFRFILYVYYTFGLSYLTLILFCFLSLNVCLLIQPPQKSRQCSKGLPPTAFHYHCKNTFKNWILFSKMFLTISSSSVNVTFALENRIVGYIFFLLVIFFPFPKS